MGNTTSSQRDPIVVVPLKPLYIREMSGTGTPGSLLDKETAESRLTGVIMYLMEKHQRFRLDMTEVTKEEARLAREAMISIAATTTAGFNVEVSKEVVSTLPDDLRRQLERARALGGLVIGAGVTTSVASAVLIFLGMACPPVGVSICLIYGGVTMAMLGGAVLEDADEREAAAKAAGPYYSFTSTVTRTITVNSTNMEISSAPAGTRIAPRGN